MSENSDLKRYVESVVANYGACYEKLIMSLIFDQDKGYDIPEFNEEPIKSLAGQLQAERKDVLANTVLSDFESFNKAVDRLENLSRALGQAEPSGEKRDIVQNIVDSYGRLIVHLRSCVEEQKSATEVDSDTGLRAEEFMVSDYKKEMERFERDGQAFCFCLIRSDALWSGDVTDVLSIIKPVAQGILSNLRLFDDAYRVDDSYVLVSLKHTGVTGAVKFFERVQRNFASMPKNEGASLSITGCITEPVSGQSLEDSIADMRKDLDVECKDVRDDYIIMSESSDLQNFLNIEEETK
ncbi:MAG: hypothetical protein JKY11_05575 [Alphaproteobacteria bacterium]|nr:hypothetical protein [Alphaproteobacteria bacterium]